MALFRKAKKAFGLEKPNGADLPKGVRVGRHTYGISRSSIQGMGGRANIEIGAFCSIANEVLFLQNEHQRTTISTWPFDRAIHGSHIDRDVRGPINVGNDVWIGRRAIILSGVTIGDGVIIGAGAIVAKDVPPYAVAVGNPARVVKYRFAPEEIEFLLTLKWWTWDDDEIQRHADLFMMPAGDFMDHFRQ